MRDRLRWMPGLALCAAAAILLTACPDQPPAEEPVQEPVEEPVEEPTPETYEAQLEEVDASGVTGRAIVVVEDDRIRVTVRAQGLNPDAEVPLHIHTNSTCDAAGGILLNLDETLTVANEAGPRGEHYPTTDGDGVLEYEVTRTLEDLRSAIAEHGGPGLEQMDLGNRVVNVHAADMRPVACGPLSPRF